MIDFSPHVPSTAVWYWVSLAMNTMTDVVFVYTYLHWVLLGGLLISVTVGLWGIVARRI